MRSTVYWPGIRWNTPKVTLKFANTQTACGPTWAIGWAWYPFGNMGPLNQYAYARACWQSRPSVGPVSHYLEWSSCSLQCIKGSRAGIKKADSISCQIHPPRIRLLWWWRYGNWTSFRQIQPGSLEWGKQMSEIHRRFNRVDQRPMMLLCCKV